MSAAPGPARDSARAKASPEGRPPRAASSHRGPGAPRPLPVSALYHRCPASQLPFRSTAELPAVETIVGQERAIEAIELAISMAGPGFNVFALGPPGIGKYTALRQSLVARAATEPVADDWCYVHDFADPQRPRALRLPAGRGAVLRSEMEELTTELLGAILAAFESEAYRKQKAALESEFETRRDQALGTLESQAGQAGIAVVRTPVGLALAPTRGGKVLSPDEFHALPDEEQAATRQAMERLGEELEAVLRTLPRWQRETRQRVRQLDRDVSAAAVRHLVDEVRQAFRDLPDVLAYLDAVEADVVERTAELLAAANRPEVPPARTRPAGDGGASGDLAERTEEVAAPAQGSVTAPEDGVLRRYRVNVIVDRSGEQGAPFVFEGNPTVANLLGRVEHLAQMGTLVTDFTLIRAGALHRANGGYLVLEAEKVLQQPQAWESLKRAVRAAEVRIESLGQSIGLFTTAALEPEPIPLRVKVALTGDRWLYYLLCARDPDFPELFKVQADFEDEVERTPQAVTAYASLIGTLARREGLRPLDRAAVARTIEHLSRMAADSKRLSAQMGRLTDLLREADHSAGRRRATRIAGADVQAAVDAQRRRAGRVSERIQEALLRGTIRLRTEGEVVGQVNALSVMQLGDAAYGHPTRVSARVRLGHGEVVDIEREVELGGPIHSKGVLILAGFLGGRFGRRPLSIEASLVFEQSYGGVEGDSASLAELCALLSAIGGLPIHQSLALTGSIDQAGDVQAIGEVNEKIEGFFDACAARGTTSEHGVLIPRDNVEHLMLAPRVVEAARAGRFHIWPVATVDEAMNLLTGLLAGAPDREGAYDPGTVNGRVAAALHELAETARQWSEAAEVEEEHPPHGHARGTRPARRHRA